MPRLAKLKTFKQRDPIGYSLAKLNCLTFLEYFQQRKPRSVYIEFVGILNEHMRSENPIDSTEVMRRVKVLLENDKSLFRYFYRLKHAIDLRASKRSLDVHP
jgi:hypothetical protein